MSGKNSGISPDLRGGGIYPYPLPFPPIFAEEDHEDRGDRLSGRWRRGWQRASRRESMDENCSAEMEFAMALQEWTGGASATERRYDEDLDQEGTRKFEWEKGRQREEKTISFQRKPSSSDSDVHGSPDPFRLQMCEMRSSSDGYEMLCGWRVKCVLIEVGCFHALNELTMQWMFAGARLMAAH
eukprot:768259-Hanusia_phi.AAC.14